MTQPKKADSPIRGDDKGTHSYGTMTYAGLLSLIYADVKKNDPRVQAAVDWLSRHYTLEEIRARANRGCITTTS
jgi:squalene-hopene/tetraprenyl-beta-curcumene cyclase